MASTRRASRVAGALFGVLTALGCAACSSPPHAAAASSATPADRSSGVHYIESPAAAPYSAPCDGPAVIAHRGNTGAASHLPENTWQAELAAAAAGATYLNMDLRWTSDGVPVALHDATVNRTTSETRPQTPITALTARQYVALNARYYATDTTAGRIDPNVHPDTLAEVLAEIAPTQKPIVLQMEADPYRAREAGATPQRDFASLAQVIESSGYAGRVIVAGWTAADVRAFHAAAPNVAVAYLFETIGKKIYPTAAEVAATGAHILYIDFRGVTAAEVATWRAGGLKVWTWTPASPAQWARLRSDGVEAVATNWTTNYLRWAPVPCSADSSE